MLLKGVRKGDEGCGKVTDEDTGLGSNRFFELHGHDPIWFELSVEKHEGRLRRGREEEESKKGVESSQRS